MILMNGTPIPSVLLEPILKKAQKSVGAEDIGEYAIMVKPTKSKKRTQGFAIYIEEKFDVVNKYTEQVLKLDKLIRLYIPLDDWLNDMPIIWETMRHEYAHLLDFSKNGYSVEENLLPSGKKRQNWDNRPVEIRAERICRSHKSRFPRANFLYVFEILRIVEVLTENNINDKEYIKDIINLPIETVIKICKEVVDEYIKNEKRENKCQK